MATNNVSNVGFLGHLNHNLDISGHGALSPSLRSVGKRRARKAKNLSALGTKLSEIVLDLGRGDSSRDISGPKIVRN